MSKRVSSTVTKRQPNPRPRKYASASERQAAYRSRAPEVCFRAEPGTVETLDRIADTLDQSRADVLLSMTKFALANHDWARFGLTHKPLPFGYGANPIMSETLIYGLPRGERERYAEQLLYGGGLKLSKDQIERVKAAASADGWHSFRVVDFDPTAKPDFSKAVKRNPMKTPARKTASKTSTKRKPTPAQLAARERFAEMARSGTFKKAGVRKKNPQGRDAGEFRMTVNGKSVTRFFVHATDEWALSYGFPYRLLSNVVDFGAPIKFGKTRATVAIDEGPDGRPVTETWEIRALKFYDGERKTNPAEARKVRRNPAAAKLYTVSRADANGKPVYHIAHFRKMAEAKQYAQAYADANKTRVAITSKAL